MKTSVRNRLPSLAPEHLDCINGGGIQVADQPSPAYGGSRYWEGPAEGPMLSAPTAQPEQLPEECFVRWGVLGSDAALTPEDGHLQEGCANFDIEHPQPAEPAIEGDYAPGREPSGADDVATDP